MEFCWLVYGCSGELFCGCGWRWLLGGYFLECVEGFEVGVEEFFVWGVLFGFLVGDCCLVDFDGVCEFLLSEVCGFLE